MVPVAQETTANTVRLPYSFSRRFSLVAWCEASLEILHVHPLSLSVLQELQRGLNAPFTLRQIDEAEFEQRLNAVWQRDSSEARQLMEDLGSAEDFFTLAEELPGVEFYSKNGQTIKMQEQAIALKEVKVTPQRIREQGDTLTYSVESFKLKQDRSIADVIAKMPGLEVLPSGTIRYQGKAINKFYIEGMDLLGGKYAMASENLSADKVKSVQVYENHQPVKVLKDIKFSEQAALNLGVEFYSKKFVV